ncbi:MAG: hypothetical protein QOI34_1440 [Verrucomicrobiota bacterium]
MRTSLCVFVVSVMCCWAAETALCSRAESAIVTRIDTVTVEMKHGKLTIRVAGMARTPSAFGRAGKLRRRNQDLQTNKEGLLEYDLVFNRPQNYSGFTLKPVNASLKESRVPAGVKGVRIFAEFNQVDEMLPEPKKKKGFSLFHKKRGDSE